MTVAEATSPTLDIDDLAAIEQHAEIVPVESGNTIFSEGDDPDGVYFIKTGQVSIVTRKFTDEARLSTLGSGDCFGEMAVLDKARRTASALAADDCVLLRLDTAAFISFMESENVAAGKIRQRMAGRYEELILAEDVLAKAGIKANLLKVSIKGDPSMRESAFSRERYESIADTAMTRLLPVLEDLILNRSAYHFFVSLSSEEVRIKTVFEPFGDHIHSCGKLLDPGYIERHFPKMDYSKKTNLIRHIYATTSEHPAFASAPTHFQKVFSDYYANWQPVSQKEIQTTLANVPTLRTIPNFYMRNFSMSMVHDAIRMQFNCDGTHIISNEDLLDFIRQNIE